MANAIFTASESSSYDDRIEERYHFPKTYLGQATQAIGELILYYEPRRDAGISSSGGRQAYFAVARLASIEPDNTRESLCASPQMPVETVMAYTLCPVFQGKL